jgi:hypothetical protein
MTKPVRLAAAITGAKRATLPAKPSASATAKPEAVETVAAPRWSKNATEKMSDSLGAVRLFACRTDESTRFVKKS